MKNLKKKAFTLVELLVVIAIIAILAVAGVVGYVVFTKKAQQSNDTSLVSQLNEYMAAASTTDNINNVSDARNILIEDGIDLASLKLAAKGYRAAFDIANKRFVKINKDTPEDYSGKAEDLFVFVSNAADAASFTNNGYSVYLQNGFDATSLNVQSGVDVGENSGITAINYTSSDDKEVIIRTNSLACDLSVNAPNGSVKHYGDAQSVNIVAVKLSSYHELGNVPFISIAQGRIVVEDKGQIQVIDASAATATVNIEKAGNGEIKNVVVGNNSNVAVASELEPKIATVTTITTWAALKTEVENNSGANVIKFEPTEDQNNVESIRVSRSISILGNGRTMTANYNTQLEETTTYKGRYPGLFCITGVDVDVFINSLNLRQLGSKGTALNINESANRTKITLSNLTLGSKQYCIATDVSKNSHTLELDNVTFDLTSFNSIYWRTSNSNVIANDCAFCSTITNASGTGSNTFGVIVICEPFYKQMNNTVDDFLMENNTFTINGGTIVAKDKALDTTAEIAIYSSYNNKVYLNDTNYDENTSMLAIVKKNIKSASFANNSEPTFENSLGSFIYVNGESADSNLNVHLCAFYPNNNYVGGNIPCFGGKTTQNPSTYYGGQDYRPLYGYEVVQNGSTWIYQKTSTI